MRKPHLIPNWKRCWRMYSVQADAIPLAAFAVWGLMPDEWRDVVPEAWLLWLAGVSFALGIVGRVVKQPEVSGHD